VLGLAILIPLSAARSEALAGTVPEGVALVEGFRLAFLGAVGIAACGILISSFLMGRKKPQA
jgi:hypothetical protein